jgi:hypothetical protein
MLELVIHEAEYWDEKIEEFIRPADRLIHLEHSLVSISKWESKWCKPFIGKTEKTSAQIYDYIRCMTLTKNVPDYIYLGLTKSEIQKITEYIDAPMTATWFNTQQENKRSTEVITSEIIYYWMIVQNIPIECQKWHLNRLLTLIKVCELKSKPPKKMGRREMLAQREALNEARLAQFKRKG